MTDRPIIFSAPMVRALLEGRKTQTRRRPFTLPTIWQGVQPGDRLWVRERWQYAKQQYCCCPQGTEAAPCDDWLAGIGCRSVRDDVVYFADGVSAPKWRPAIHMPRWASRLTLVVTEVRRQRLQEISEEDVRAEGVQLPVASDTGSPLIEMGGATSPLRYVEPRRADETPADVLRRAWTFRAHFAALWDTLHGPGSWDANPDVVALTFTVHRCNIDAIDKEAA